MYKNAGVNNHASASRWFGDYFEFSNVGLDGWSWYRGIFLNNYFLQVLQTVVQEDVFSREWLVVPGRFLQEMSSAGSGQWCRVFFQEVCSVSGGCLQPGVAGGARWISSRDVFSREWPVVPGVFSRSLQCFKRMPSAKDGWQCQENLFKKRIQRTRDDVVRWSFWGHPLETL